MKHSGLEPRTFWPGSTTSTRRSEMGCGAAYARSSVWFGRSAISEAVSGCDPIGCFKFVCVICSSAIQHSLLGFRRTRRQSQRQ